MLTPIEPDQGYDGGRMMARNVGASSTSRRCGVAAIEVLGLVEGAARRLTALSPASHVRPCDLTKRHQHRASARPLITDAPCAVLSRSWTPIYAASRWSLLAGSQPSQFPPDVCCYPEDSGRLLCVISLVGSKVLLTLTGQTTSCLSNRRRIPSARS